MFRLSYCEIGQCIQPKGDREGCALSPRHERETHRALARGSGHDIARGPAVYTGKAPGLEPAASAGAGPASRRSAGLRTAPHPRFTTCA